VQKIIFAPSQTFSELRQALSLGGILKKHEMIRNYFYLVVGLLCILFAVTHTLNGVETSLSSLDYAQIENNAKVAFTYVWHIIGIENLVFGIALLIMAFRKNQLRVKFTAWLIIVVLAMRWIVISYFTVLNNNGNFKLLIPDTIAIFVVIILLLLGTKVKERISNE
jgi:hypothetical protein